ncbi:hypothetical protein KQX54_004628 [Cotesia glomerata]|uniref:Uncharacterized protein n=1 Tax=Cotesia glomerata TaxID=32391 RepID=A0AAV7HVZ4_COTGL|nr:hypothetical protein KQX54_004628 [Cotesia glomerata]
MEGRETGNEKSLQEIVQEPYASKSKSALLNLHDNGSRPIKKRSVRRPPLMKNQIAKSVASKLPVGRPPLLKDSASKSQIPKRLIGRPRLPKLTVSDQQLSKRPVGRPRLEKRPASKQQVRESSAGRLMLNLPSTIFIDSMCPGNSSRSSKLGNYFKI